MKLGLVQMVSGVDVAANLAAAIARISEAADGGAELVVLPENFSLLGRGERDKLAAAEAPGAGPVQARLAGLARELGVWIVGGTVPLRGPKPDRVFNSCLVFDPAGGPTARYDKIHLFRLDHGAEQFDEAATVAPGQEPVTFDLASRDGERWRVGLSVCYDLRFPELYRTLSARGATLLLVPSAFTWTTGQAHWEVLLRARAIENLAWVAAPAQGGRHANGRRTWGHSMAIDPWGTVCAVRDEGEGVLTVDLDMQAVHAARARLPALGHRML